MEERLFYVGFSVFPGVGPKKFAALISTFDNAKSAWETSEEQLREVLGVSLAAKFTAFKLTFSLQNYIETLDRAGIQYITSLDDDYPQLLRALSNAPIVLFAKGNLSLLAEPCTISIVGTRKVTSYGKDVTAMLTKELVSRDIVIVSGLAIGIDSIAHETTVAHGGKTIAVLGCGVACCTPLSNQRLYDTILANDGLIVSESPFGAASLKGLFPSRNRIIAGLSQGVLVTEGAEDSGALITAARAEELHRPVFAVPGHITSSLSQGPIKLMQHGAIVVSSVHDILDRLGLDKTPYNKKMIYESADPFEQAIISLLGHESLYFDEVVRKVKKDSAHVAGILSIMELKGIVKNESNGKYALANI